MKAVVDRIVQYANRYQLTDVSTGQVLGTFDFDEVTGTVQQVGTEIDAELFQTIADDLAARVKLSGGELKDTVVTFSDISGTAANVASGDTSSTLWGKVKNWFSRLKALAFKDTISNSDVASNAAIAQSKVNGLESALATKANDADLATIAKSGKLSDATEDATHRTVTDAEKETWNEKQDALTFDTTPTEGSTNPVTSGGIKAVLDEKQETVTGGASTIVFFNLTESRALVSDASGKVAVSDVTATELGYLDGVNSNIQEQLDNISGGTGFVSTYPQTLTSKQQAQARSNIGAQASGNYALQDGTYPNLNTPKTLYNLGAYDTHTSNGDGTATITRKTGYVDLSSLSWGNASEGEDCYYALYSGAVGGDCKCGKYKTVTDTVIGSTDKAITYNNNTFVIHDSDISSASDVAGALYGVQAQVELTTSYTEQVIENQPLNTLPQAGEQWVREEWEKGLNLFNKDDVEEGYAVSDTDGTIFALAGDSVSGFIPIKPNTRYIYTPSDAAHRWFAFYDSNKQYISGVSGDDAVDFVSPSNVAYVRLTVPISNLDTTMFVEGSHPYPYQPYNGEIVRTGTDETITGAKTFTQNVTISKRYPQLQLIDEQGRRTLLEVQEETGGLNLIRRLSADDNVNDYVIQFLATSGVVALQSGDGRPTQLNAERNDEANIAYGYNDTNDNGLLYVNYRGANDTIQGYRFCAGKGTADMADIYGKNIYDNGVRVYSPNNPQPLRIATKVSGSNIDGGAAPSFSLSSGDYSKSMLVFVAKESNNNSTPFTSATVLPTSVFGSSNTVVGVYRDGANMQLNVTRSGTTISIARRDTYFANYLWVYEIY